MKQKNTYTQHRENKILTLNIEQIKYLHSTFSKKYLHLTQSKENTYTQHRAKKILTLNIKQIKYLNSTWSKENTYTQHRANKILTLNIEQIKYLHSTKSKENSYNQHEAKKINKNILLQKILCYLSGKHKLFFIKNIKLGNFEKLIFCIIRLHILSV